MNKALTKMWGREDGDCMCNSNFSTHEKYNFNRIDTVSFLDLG